MVSAVPPWVKRAPRLSFQIWLRGHCAGLLPLSVSDADVVLVVVLALFSPDAGWLAGAPAFDTRPGALAADDPARIAASWSPLTQVSVPSEFCAQYFCAWTSAKWPTFAKKSLMRSVAEPSH